MTLDEAVCVARPSRTLRPLTDPAPLASTLPELAIACSARKDFPGLTLGVLIVSLDAMQRSVFAQWAPICHSPNILCVCPLAPARQVLEMWNWGALVWLPRGQV